MEIKTLQTAEQVPFNLDGRIMFSDQRVELVHLSLNPGEQIDLHANPFDVVFFTLEGNGLVLFEEQKFEVKSNASVFIEKDKQRGLVNNGSSLFRVLVIKVF